MLRDQGLLLLGTLGKGWGKCPAALNCVACTCQEPVLQSEQPAERLLGRRAGAKGLLECRPARLGVAEAHAVFHTLTLHMQVFGLGHQRHEVLGGVHCGTEALQRPLLRSGQDAGLGSRALQQVVDVLGHFVADVSWKQTGLPLLCSCAFSPALPLGPNAGQDLHWPLLAQHAAHPGGHLSTKAHFLRIRLVMWRRGAAGGGQTGGRPEGSSSTSAATRESHKRSSKTRI